MNSNMNALMMAIAYRFIVFGCMLILCASYPLASADVAAKTCYPDPEKCLDRFADCKSSQTCYYGTCTALGACECFDCFHGDQCDQYNDNAVPRFEERTGSVYISGSEKSAIYRARAADADAITQCSAVEEDIDSQNCPCAAISYSIINDEHSNFQIDSKTGDVYITNHRKDRTYRITILATGYLANQTLSTNQDSMELTVYVMAEEQPSARVKRNAGNTEASTTIVMSKETDPSSTESKLGDKIDYKMEIDLPILTTPMDLKVEIFTSDPETKQAAFALRKPIVTIESDVQNQLSGDPQMFTNHYFSTIFDRATMDFGDVTGTGSTNKIIINFSVVTIMTNATHTSPYRVSAGAEYKNQSYVWVGQSQLTIVTDEVFFDTLATVTGPSTIEQDSFGIYSVESVLAGPCPDVTFAAFLTVGDEDVISIGSIGAETIGSDFSATVDFAADRSLAPPVYAYSVSKKSVISSSMNIDFIANEVVSDTTNSKITWVFSVWAIGGVPIPTEDLKLGIAMQLTQDKIWTSVKTVTVVPGSPVADKTFTFTSAELSSTDPIPAGGTAIIIAKFSVEAGGKADVTITVDTPAGLSHCQTHMALKGFNIPYLPNTEFATKKVDGKSTIKLGYIGNTGQVSTGDNVDDFWLEIGIQIGKDVADGSYTVTMESGGASHDASITVQASAKSTEDVVVTIGPSEGSAAMLSGWLTGAAAAIDVTATFPAKHALTDMTVEGTGMLNNFDFDIRVCKIDVSYKGVNIPCINKPPQTFQKTADTRKYDDYLIWPIGTLCSAARTSPGKNSTWDNKVIFTVAYELPLTETATANPYSLSAGLKLDQEKIWAGLVPFTTSATKVNAYSSIIQPIWNVHEGSATVPLNAVNIAKFYFKMPPGAHVVLVMNIAVDPTQLVICPLQIKFGSGFPCEDEHPFKKWAESDPTTLNYEHDAATESKGAKTAILDFKNIHNIGTSPLVSSAVFDSNTIEVILPVYVLATGSATITVTGNGITPAFSQTHTFTTDGTTAIKSAASDVTLTLTEDKITGSYEGYKETIAKTALLRIDVVEGFYAEPLVVEVSNAQNFNMCCAAIYEVGKHLPCVNASTIPWEQVPGPTPDSDGNPIMSTLKITLDLLCQYPLTKDSDQNQLTIMVAFKVGKGAGLGSVTLSAKAILGADETAPVTVDIAETTDVNVPVIEEPEEGGAVDLLDDSDGNGEFGDAMDASIGQLVWLKFGLGTVSSMIAEYQVAAFGRVEDSRAEITVHDVRIVKEETGVNIICVNDAHEFEITIGKANDTLPYSQNNMLLMKLGPIVNTGVSKRLLSDTPEDNRIVLEVLIRVTDHPLNIHDKQVMVDVGGMMGKVIVITQQPMTIKRQDTDYANIVVELNHNNQTEPFKKNDEVVLSALLYHDNETSSREPAPGYVRFIWAPYMKYKDESLEVNSTFTSLLNGSTHMDVEFDYILFDDWISINLTLETDPQEVRKPGAGLINAITLARPVCKYEQMDAEGGTKSPPDTPARHREYCGDIAHVAYEVDAPECYDDLNFGSLDATCIIASTEAKTREAALVQGPNVWSPAYGPKQSEDYLIINFLGQKRITKLKVFGSAPDRKVTQFKIEAGATEYGFQSPQIVAVGADDTAILDNPIVGQFIRFTIVEATGSEAEYIGVRLEFYGCPQGTAAPDTPPCTFQQTTRNGISWRNIAHDAGNDYIYYCYYSEKKKNMACFCTQDGSKWREIPSYVGYMVGSKDGYMYAQDQKKQAYLKSPDCDHWLVEDAFDSSGITAAEAFPGNKDLSDVAVGPWTATQEGLKRDGKMLTKWFDCCA